MILLYAFLKESFLFAVKALKANVLRTVLTLSGVTIGIFSIISVLTLVNFLESRVRESIQSLGDNVVYVQKWPWSPPEGETEYPWWKYLNRPLPSLNEQRKIEQKSQLTESSTFVISAVKSVQFEKNAFDNVNVLGVSENFDKNWNFEISSGRYFSALEINKGNNVVLLGAEVAEELFQGGNPVGKKVKLMGRKLSVIGVFEKEGSDMFGNSLDKNIVIPIYFARGLFNLRSEAVNPFIIVKAKQGVSVDDLMLELEGIMRGIRRIKPAKENNFALNRISIIQKQFDGLFGIIDLAGWLIGGFSIVVGGFGIANIMFVSVKERTKIIGIQKALGAKRKFILWQFLFESMFLSLMGGVVGLLLIFIITLVVNMTMDLNVVLTISNILKGILISASLGIAFGLIPANGASKLDPVVAINA